MANLRWRMVWSGVFARGIPLPDCKAQQQELIEGASWPPPPEAIIRVEDPDTPYVVDVETRRDQGGNLHVTGIAVRVTVPTKPQPDPEPNAQVRWPDVPGYEGVPCFEDLPDVSPRDVRRLPLSTYMRVARAVRYEETDPDLKGKASREQWLRSIEAASVPRGRPKMNDTRFYKEIANSYTAFQAQGRSPAKEIARRKRVSRNLVDQWIYRARQLGFLEPAGRRSQREMAK
jgi:hypothetical protein